MKRAHNILLLAILLASTLVNAQGDNIFLNRDFWKGDVTVSTVAQKIKEGNDPSMLNANAFDATVYALLEKKDVAVIKYLLAQPGNDVAKKTHDSRIYLHWAAYAGDVATVTYLLKEGSSTTALDSHSFTPLAFGINAGQVHPAIIDAFEDAGVNLTAQKSDTGVNLLLLAAPSLKTDADLDYFLNKGFDINTTDTKGNGIFNYAAKKGNIDFLKTLVARGVAYKNLASDGGNAFMFAAQGGRGYSNSLAVYEYLQSLGLEANVVTKQGTTPLHRLAYSNKDAAIFNFFINAGVDVNQKDKSGTTAFHNAAARNNLAIVQLLAKQLIDINTVNDKGQTPLMLAVGGNDISVVQYILDNGGDAFAKDKAGNSLASYLVQSYRARNPKAFESKLALLSKKGVSLTTTQAEGNTPLHLAVLKNDVNLVKQLLTYKPAINAKNSEGLTALHIAAMKAKDDRLMKLLIASGADHTVKTDFEESVLDLATENELLQQNNIPLTFLK